MESKDFPDTYEFQAYGRTRGAAINKKKIEPTRTTKTNPKLVLFPDSGVDLSSIIDYSANIRPEHDGDGLLELRRVTAYLTAESFNLRDIHAYLCNERRNNGVDPKRYDEVLYTPFYFQSNKTGVQNNHGYLEHAVASSLPVGEVFYFDYGAVVIWGLDETQEQQLLLDLKPFERMPLSSENVEIEAFQFCHNPELPPRLVNDVINLKSGHHMIKLTISHALAQSVKLALFEELVERAILRTKDIPSSLATHGTIAMSR